MLPGQAGNLNAVALTPDGKLLAAAGASQTIKLWSLGDGTPPRTLEGHGGVVYALAISPDGRVLASGSEDKTVKLWSLPDGQPLPVCLMDLQTSSSDAKGIEYTSGGASYTQTCGSPIPPGAICTCNCVPGAVCSCVSVCSCVGHTSSSGGGGGSHYWYPN
jgi:WD40 repeat protein